MNHLFKLTLCCVLGVIAPASAQDSSKIEISQKDRRFHPAAISVPRNSTLYVLNDDKFTHHVFFNKGGKQFDSGEQPPGETVSLTMDEPGEFEVLCAIHPKMRLKISVGDE
ncbi:cupredoxin domain-containing protein [Hyphococcus sp.]|uniref:cupredoxin domain-containing protein n=1 Tax=Hyphococcus sp. TaxID=2038636 RepID=UPI003CCC0D70